MTQLDPKIVAWTKCLVESWQFFNHYYLSNQLRLPGFDIFLNMGKFGYWAPQSRLIGISWHHIEEHPWTRVMDTLKHEMAHQFVDEILKTSNQKPHGDAFQFACQKLRVPSKAQESWYFNPSDDFQNGSDSPVIKKISKLLSLAQSSNENEAQLAMKKARELLMKHQIGESEISDQVYRVLEMGPAKSRFLRWEKKLMSILQEFFFVKIIWTPCLVTGKNILGSVPLAHGTPENLAMADYVYSFFIRLLPQLWDDHKITHNVRSNKDRMEYFFGILHGFSEKLSEQTVTLERTKSLVWKGDSKLNAFYDDLHPHIQSRHSSSYYVGESFFSGQEKGRSVTLNRPIENKSSSNSRKLLH